LDFDLLVNPLKYHRTYFDFRNQSLAKYLFSFPKSFLNRVVKQFMHYDHNLIALRN